MFYNEFTKQSGKEGVSKDQAKAAAKQNQNPVQRAMSVLAEIFSPLIPAIVVGGLILGFRNILEGIQMESLGQLMQDGVAQVTATGEPIFNRIVDVSEPSPTESEIRKGLPLAIVRRLRQVLSQWMQLPYAG